MAATRLIALHINKGKTLAQCLKERTDYSENGEKTNNGTYVSTYECDAKTAKEVIGVWGEVAKTGNGIFWRGF